MTQTLDTRQLNNLRTGNNLAAELSSSSENRRAFVVVGAYKETGKGGERVSRFLNADQRDTRFWFRKYEVDNQVINLRRNVGENDLHDSVFRKGISRVEELEGELSKYLADFGILDVAWKCDNPI